VYFDHFLKDPSTITTPRNLEGAELRIFIADAIGLEPKEYAHDTPEGQRIAAIERQINEIRNMTIEHGDEVVGITMIPMLYVSKEGGRQETALFRLEIRFNRDHEPEIDDHNRAYAGSEFAPPPLDDYTERAGKAQEAGGDGMEFLIGDRAESVGDDARAGRYDSLQHLLDDGPYADEGKLYLPRDLKLSTKENGHADVVSFDSNNVDWWEKVGDAAVGVATAVGGVALTVATGGMAAVALGVVAAGTAYGAVRSIQTLEELERRGQSTTLSNPEARGAWINLASSALGVATVAGGVRAFNLMQRGQKLANGGNLAEGQTLYDHGKRLSLTSNGADISAGVVATVDQLNTMSDHGMRASPVDTLLTGVGIGLMGAGGFGLKQTAKTTLVVGPNTSSQSAVQAMTTAPDNEDYSLSAGYNPQPVKLTPDDLASPHLWETSTPSPDHSPAVLPEDAQASSRVDQKAAPRDPDELIVVEQRQPRLVFNWETRQWEAGSRGETKPHAVTQPKGSRAADGDVRNGTAGSGELPEPPAVTRARQAAEDAETQLKHESGRRRGLNDEFKEAVRYGTEDDAAELRPRLEAVYARIQEAEKAVKDAKTKHRQAEEEAFKERVLEILSWSVSDIRGGEPRFLNGKLIDYNPGRQTHANPDGYLDTRWGFFALEVKRGRKYNSDTSRKLVKQIENRHPHLPSDRLHIRHVVVLPAHVATHASRQIEIAQNLNERTGGKVNVEDVFFLTDQGDTAILESAVPATGPDRFGPDGTPRYEQDREILSRPAATSKNSELKG
jgi:hypothetical protein